MKSYTETMTKIVKWRNFYKIKPFLKNKRTVLAGGCFDLLHYGHLQFLKKAKDTGDFLIVVLESDEFIRFKKKRSPIHNQDQRAQILASLKMVDLVVLLPYFQEDAGYFLMVKKIQPKVIVATAGDDQRENKKKQAEMVGAEFKEVSPRLKEFASSRIIKSYEAIFSD